MNYFERHIGDYAKDAGHLSMLEHGAYTLLLDRYYSTEQGIQEGKAHRLCRARTDEEIAAVDAVLDEFFELVDGVWTNRRAEEEIAKAKGRISAAKENGKKGGRPAREASETQQEPNPNPTLTQQEPNPLDSETQPKAHHVPSTMYQTPEDQSQKQQPAQQASSEVDARPEKPAAVAAIRFDAIGFLIDAGVEQQTAADYLTLRKSKKAPATKTALSAIVREIGSARMAPQAGVEMCCLRGWVGFKAEWIDSQQARAGPPKPAKFDPVAHINRNRTRSSETADIIDITAERLA